jgi:hypothetical protein
MALYRTGLSVLQLLRTVSGFIGMVVLNNIFLETNPILLSDAICMHNSLKVRLRVVEDVGSSVGYHKPSSNDTVSITRSHITRATIHDLVRSEADNESKDQEMRLSQKK